MITVNRAKLARELAIVNALVSARGVIPVLSTVLLGFDGETLRLTTTNLDVTAVCELPAVGEPWGGCVPCEQLTRLVRLLEGEDVTLTPQGHRLVVKVQGATHRLPLVEQSAFPQIDMLTTDAATLPLPALKAMIAATSFAILEVRETTKADELRYTGLSLKSRDGTLECMATRKVVTAIAEMPCDAQVSAIVPREAVAVLGRLEGETVSMASSESQVQFTAGPRTLLCRTLMGEFPDWRMFIPAYEHAAQVDVAAFTAAIKRASVTMDVDNAVGFTPMKLTIGRDALSVETRDGDHGESNELVPITSNLNGSEVAIGFVGQQVLSVLRGEQVTCKFVDASSPMLFEGEGVRYVVMPVRLREW